MSPILSFDRTALVLSAGGERAVAWHVGVLAGLYEHGVDPRRARRIVGTSAGALVAARLARGDDPVERAARLADRPTAPPPPASDAEADALPGALPGLDWPGRLRVVAVDALTGGRVAFGPAAGIAPALAVAASRAVPGLRPAVSIGGRPHVDGALRSATNADLAATAGVDRVLVLDANGPAGDPLSRLWAAALEEEVAALEARGVAVAAIRAGEEDRAAMGADPMDGSSAAAAAVEAGRLAAARWMARVAPTAVML